MITSDFRLFWTKHYKPAAVTTCPQLKTTKLTILDDLVDDDKDLDDLLDDFTLKINDFSYFSTKNLRKISEK